MTDDKFHIMSGGWSEVIPRHLQERCLTDSVSFLAFVLLKCEIVAELSSSFVSHLGEVVLPFCSVIWAEEFQYLPLC